VGSWWLVLALVVAGGALGVVLARQLAVVEYRIDEEEDRPPLRALWAVPPALAATWGILGWHLGGRAGGVALPAYLLLAVSGVALWRIDLDVHRLPEGLTLPTALATALLLLLATALVGDWSAAARAGVGGLATLLGLGLLSLLTGGAFGFGDVVLGATLGLALGWLDLRAALWGPAFGFVIAGVVAVVGLATRRMGMKSDLAMGPYLLLGALVAVLSVP
jgi:leader peptidase (prepilin peptidase)/N-methyltransferase